MKLGHILALIGAILAIVGATLLPWQQFELAHVIAYGYQVPVTGQGVLGLGVLLALSSVLGLALRKRRQFATLSLFLAACLLAWVVAANVTRASAFKLMPFEVVELLAGYTLAVWGGFLGFFGALVVLASGPSWKSHQQFLRVALLWGDTVVQERVLQEPQIFHIGEDLRNDFIIPADKLPKKFPLFRANRKGDYAIGLSQDLDGEITINRETLQISEFVKRGTENTSGINFVDVGAGDWGMLHLGELSIFFQFVQADSRIAKKGFLVFDEMVLSAIAVSFLLQVGFVAYSVFSWKEQAVRVVKKNTIKIPKIEAIVITPEKKPPEEGKENDTTAKRAANEEGKFGDPDKNPNKKSIVPKNEGKMVDHINPKKIGLNDLLSTNKLGGSGEIANILNSNTNGFSNKIAVAMAGSGSEFVMGYGAGGMGFKGTGTGGGGDGGYGRIHGMGKIDTGGGMGIRAGLGRKHARHVGRMHFGAGATQGFCSKSNIRSVVRRRAGAIRACYEERLQINTKLQGKVTVRWTIKLNGAVASASTVQNTVGDSYVTNCIMRVIRRMRFEKPKGGICIVQWPFVFSPAG